MEETAQGIKDILFIIYKEYGLTLFRHINSYIGILK